METQPVPEAKWRLDGSRGGFGRHQAGSPHATDLLCLLRFRVGFKRAFRWCPFINASEYEGLEMKSARYLQAQSSMYKASRMETTVSSVTANPEEELDDGSRPRRPSVDLTSNGSSRSDTKTISESLSFYSNTLP